MRKIKLELDHLTVASFETASTAKHGEGTVHANEPTRGTNDGCQTPIDGCATGFCAPTQTC